MLDLTNVTIISINCVNPWQSVSAIRHSMKKIKFKEAILFTDHPVVNSDIRTVGIPKLTWNGYNDLCLKLIGHIDSDYVLVIQDDGFVTNPDKWNDDFLNYDYIGAPWPNEESWIEKQPSRMFIRQTFRYNRVGNGGFSLRSRNFLKASAKFADCARYGEDIFLCTISFPYMQDNGIKFAPVELAHEFSYENPLLEFGHSWQDRIALDPNAHFGFHGRQFTNSEEIINLKDLK